MCGHRPLELFCEAVLQLHGAPLIERCVPCGRHQSGRTGDRTRIPRSVRQVAGKDLAFVRRDQHIVVGGALRHRRHLLLNLGNAAVGPPRAAGVLEYPLLDDLGAEPCRGMAQRFGEQSVTFV